VGTEGLYVADVEDENAAPPRRGATSSLFDPYQTSGILRRVAPFVAAIVFGLALIPVQNAPIEASRLALAIGAIFGLVTIAVVIGRFAWVPSWLPRTLPVLDLLAIVLLRDATGGVLSGYGALFFLAPFWVALYDTRRQVLLVIGAMFLAQAGQGLYEANFEDITAVRRALLSASVIGFISLAVQRNVAVLRIAQRDLAHSNAQLARSNEHLEHNQDALTAALERESAIVEQLQELDRLKTRFVAMASHELRTPLASIGGFASTLRERWDQIREPDRLEYIGIIDEQGQRLSRLVDDLLVLSRIESGALHTNPESVELDHSIRMVLTELGVEPDVRVLVPAKATVHADPDHLEQILVNYMTNALKYGSAPITVESSVHDEFVELVVRDSGTGVPVDVEALLFEEFARGQQHTAAQVDGTGLGLSIVRGLARAQGGDAWYEPNRPNGAVFGVRLPIAAPAAS
jgi:signal transduction histidine kinase